MKQVTLNKYLRFFSLAIILFMSACVNEDFDTPSTDGDDPNITPNTTIAELKVLHAPGEYEQLPDGLIFDAIIVSSDQTGNFFRQLVVQDETGGIEMRVDETDLFNEFPPGRRVFVHSDGLFFGDFAGLTQLGGAVVPDGNFLELERISSAKFREAVIPGMRNQHIIPAIKTINDINIQDVSTLVQIDEVEFSRSDAGVMYADPNNPSGPSSVNRIIKDCFNNDIILRNSGYSDFASDLTPEGNGTITAVVGIFNTDLQLFIRDLDDVNMTETICGGGGGGGGSLTIQELKDAFAGGASAAPEGTIKCTVISDLSNGSITGRNAVAQEGTAGIIVRFDANHPFTQGQEIEVDVTGVELSEFAGVLQVNGVALSNASGLANVGDPTPRLTTVAELLTNGESWESTLIELTDVTFSGSTIWNGDLMVSDASGTISHYTRQDADFANNQVPATATSIVAFVSEFNGTREIQIRNLNDLDGAGGGGGGCSLENVATIIELRDGFACGASNIISGSITGVVISDFANENTTGRNMVIQDASGGIVVRFDANHSFPLGQQISFNLAGLDVSEFNGLFQLNAVIADAIDQGVGTLPTPRVATLAEINSNLEVWESTVLQISNATISGGATYGDNNGSLTVDDGTGQMELFTRSAASFAATAIPGNAVTLTCVISQFNDSDLFIRNLSDVN